MDQHSLPSVFISHGTPMLALADDEFTDAVQAFAAKLPLPRAIVIVSPHSTSESGLVEICAAQRCYAIHDFKGFPGELYQLDYPCPGSPELAVRVAALAAGAGFQTALRTTGGLDHGVWIPLRIAYPGATVPVVQISLPYPTDPREVLKLGKTLAPLREDNVLLIGSGGAVHNLEHLVWHGKNGAPSAWAVEFDHWLKKHLVARDVKALVNFDEAPHSRLAHPTPEHFLPLLFTVGASLAGDQVLPIFEGIQYGSLSMLSFALTA